LEELANMPKENIICPICKRETPDDCQEKHHLIPKSKKGHEIILVCCSCGDMLHQLFSIKELSKKYNTLEAILANQDVQNWITWIAKKPNDFTICMARKKRK